MLVSPLVAFYVLRVRAMAPVELPDPSMHTIYILDPRDMFVRYTAALTPTARLREGAQAGFLVLARLIYLGFGAVPGFFVTRYVLALVAVVPAYVLVRRLYGIPAGAVAVVVLLSSPVVLTAWGTDYPDAAVVSYVAGAVACLAMPCRDRWRPAWLVAGGTLLTLAVWSHGMGALLAATTIVVYGALRLSRDRRHILRDTFLLAGVGVLATLGLMVASGLVLGQFDFIRPTLAGEAYLNQPSQIPFNHSSNRDWVLYVAYLLVPPSVVAAFAVTFAGRLRATATPQLFVGLVCAAQLAVFGYLQFFNHVQTLEMHFFSSTLWGVICLALAVTIAELSRPLRERPLMAWLPAALLVAVPVGYEADPHVPALGWLPAGAVLAAVPVALAASLRLWRPRPSVHSGRTLGLGVGVATTIVGMAGCLLVLTVATRPGHAPLPGIALAGDPAPSYGGALGGDASDLIDWYQVSAEIPSFVGNATYEGEQLLMWYPVEQTWPLIEPIGLYHSSFNSLSDLPTLTSFDAAKLALRRPAEVLFYSSTGAGFKKALEALGPYRPVLLRRTVLHDGAVSLHAWLVVLKSYARRAAW